MRSGLPGRQIGGSWGLAGVPRRVNREADKRHSALPISLQPPALQSAAADTPRSGRATSFFPEWVGSGPYSPPLPSPAQGSTVISMKLGHPREPIISKKQMQPYLSRWCEPAAASVGHVTGGLVGLKAISETAGRVALDGSCAERRRKPDQHRRGSSVSPIREPAYCLTRAYRC